MKKNMYSLMLAEDVVREIDALAAQENTNRSNLVNQILAEYVSLVTPEKRIDNIFHAIENIMHENSDLSLFFEPHDNTLSIKSSLQYRYRPTIRYEVEMDRTPQYTIGELKVNFRTQSPELLTELTRFFKLWIKLEQIYVLKFFSEDVIRYGLDENRFTRSFSIPMQRNYDPEQIGEAIGNYVETFDDLLKGWLASTFGGFIELENAYLAHLNGGMLII